MPTFDEGKGEKEDIFASYDNKPSASKYVNTISYTMNNFCYHKFISIYFHCGRFTPTRILEVHLVFILVILDVALIEYQNPGCSFLQFCSHMICHKEKEYNLDKFCEKIMKDMAKAKDKKTYDELKQKYLHNLQLHNFCLSF